MDFEDIKQTVEIEEDRFYFTVLGEEPTDGKDTHFFWIDDVLQYEPFYTGCDFGPLHIGQTYRFCGIVNEKLEEPKHKDKKIIFYCGNVEQYKSNAAVLIGAWQILYREKSAAEVYEALSSYEPYLPFRDASVGICYYKLYPKHVLRAIEKAFNLGWIDFESFNVEEYEYFECVENGDLNTIIPETFIAFATPYSDGHAIKDYPTLAPEDYFPIWERYNVKTIIRLNKQMYNKKRFTDKGYIHHDMYFTDGTIPKTSIIEKFLNVVEENEGKGTIAVHCKAGLGRTGSLMGCYIMKHYRMTHSEVIAWIRLCRPGSVIGPQQHFLKTMQSKMWASGEEAGLHDKLLNITKPSPSPKMSELRIGSPGKCSKTGDGTGCKGAPSPRKNVIVKTTTSTSTEETKHREEKKQDAS